MLPDASWLSPCQDEFRSAGRRLKDLSAAAAKARAEQAEAEAEAEAEAPAAPQPPSDAPPAVRRRRSKKTGAWILKEEAPPPPRAAESQGVVLDLADHVREAELIEKVRAKVQAVPADAVGAPILSAQKRASWLKTASTLSSTAPPHASAWWLPGPRPLLHRPEHGLSSLEARLSSLQR